MSKFILNMHEVVAQAFDALINPIPSIKLPDWNNFNKVTGGLRMREFSILCGATGAGKTTFLANLSAQLLKAEIKHFVMSVETGHVDFVTRVISVLHGKDLNALESPLHPNEAMNIIRSHQKSLMNETIRLSIYDNRVSLDTLISDLESMALEGCKVAIIDNLNFFMEVTRASDSIIEMDRVVHEVIMFCKRTDMHVFMVMHPKKTENTRIMSEFDIKGSSTAVQEAQNVFLFNRPSLEDLENKIKTKFNRELLIAKMRRRGKYAGEVIDFNCYESVYSEVTC